MSIKVRSLDEHFRPRANDEVKVKNMGNIIELVHRERVNSQIFIKKISDDQYIDLRTGEVKALSIDVKSGSFILSIF